MSVLQRARTLWQRWLCASGDLTRLALFRIGWSLAMLAAVQHEDGLFELYSSDQYHVPLLRWAVPLGSVAFHNLMRLAALGCVLTLIGWWHRIGVVLVIATLGYLFATDLLLFRNHVYLGLLTGVLLGCSQCQRVLSVEAGLRRLRGQPKLSSGSLLAVQLIQAQIVIVYGYSVLNKLRRPFLDGFTLQKELPYALRTSPLHAWLCDAHGALRPTVESLLHSDRAMSAVSCAVVGVEALLALGLPSRRLRGYAIGCGLAMHANIFLLMDIRVFGLLMVSAYPLFGSTRAQATADYFRESRKPSRTV